MSLTLKMANEQLTLFQKGEMGLIAMWDKIENNLAATLRSDEHPDPFEDDKAERRIRPNRQTLNN
jgi:hypothetical protein